MATLKVLAFAAASGRIASVVIDGDTLIDWRLSVKAAETAKDASAYGARLIKEFAPDAVVTEDVFAATHKGSKSRALITALAETAEEAGVLSVSLPREQRYANKYAEAEALVTKFPELRPWQPATRVFYDSEPRNTVLFEALALALQLMNK